MKKKTEKHTKEELQEIKEVWETRCGIYDLLKAESLEWYNASFNENFQTLSQFYLKNYDAISRFYKIIPLFGVNIVGKKVVIPDRFIIGTDMELRRVSKDPCRMIFYRGSSHPSHIRDGNLTPGELVAERKKIIDTYNKAIFKIDNKSILEGLNLFNACKQLVGNNSIREYYKTWISSDLNLNLKEGLHTIERIEQIFDNWIYDIQKFFKYQKILESFYSTLKQNQNNSAYNYFLELESLKMEIKHKDILILHEDEEKIKQQLKILLLNLTKQIKEKVLDLATRFTRFEIREISEKSGIDNQNIIIEVVKNMIKKKEIYAEFFSSSNTIAFDQQANITEIDDLMKKFKEWEKEEKDKI